MDQSLSIQLGNFLYKNAFPIYNLLYPIFKKKQDSKELQLIRSHIKPGFHVLDIGANIGFYTTFFSKLVREKGHIYAFEPENTNFTHLQRNCGSFKNVTLINKAISDKTGLLKIYLSNMLNVDHRTYPVDDYSQVNEINATTVDDYLASNNISRIDFIKMDIQGFEMAAFNGMSKTLRNNPSIKIVTELWPYGLAKAGSSALEIIDFANSEGFGVYLVTSVQLELLTKQIISELKQDENSYYNVFFSKEHL